jgi:hypothetical protein
MDDLSERFLNLIHEFEDIAQSVPVNHAHAEFDEMVLQVFWQRWPELSDWAGTLWHLLSEELAGAATMHMDPELDELGDGG